MPEINGILSTDTLRADGANVMLIGNMLWQTGLRKVRKLLTPRSYVGCTQNSGIVATSPITPQFAGP